jgi:ParB/RepB/Spo0J family partition protein
MAQTQLLHIPIVKIHEPDTALRKVDRETEEYQGLVESIRMKGVMNPINVRELKDPQTGELIYGLVDGLQRLNASKDAGLETIPAQVIALADGELIEAQILANVHKIETKPVEYSRALLKVLENNPLMTRSELAARLAKTTPWISERLGLLKLDEEIGKMVDADEIGLSNAYALAKLPPEEQVQFVDRAISMPPQQFAATVNARVKELRDAKRAGRDAKPAEFAPVPILRSRTELLTEKDHPAAGPVLIGKNNITNPLEAFRMAVAWAISLDPDSIEIQRVKDEERKEELKRKKEANTIERKKQRAKEAAEKAALLQKEAEGLEAVK